MCNRLTPLAADQEDCVNLYYYYGCYNYNYFLDFWGIAQTINGHHRSFFLMQHGGVAREQG